MDVGYFGIRIWREPRAFGFVRVLQGFVDVIMIVGWVLKMLWGGRMGGVASSVWNPKTYCSCDESD